MNVRRSSLDEQLFMLFRGVAAVLVELPTRILRMHRFDALIVSRLGDERRCADAPVRLVPVGHASHGTWQHRTRDITVDEYEDILGHDARVEVFELFDASRRCELDGLGK